MIAFWVVNAKEKLSGLHLDQPVDIQIGALVIKNQLVALLLDQPNSKRKNDTPRDSISSERSLDFCI